MKLSVVVSVLFLFSLQVRAQSDEIETAYSRNQQRYQQQQPQISDNPVDQIKIVTMNLGLLARPEVPNLVQRSQILTETLEKFLDTEQPDIVAFQEAWDDIRENLHRIREVASKKGYYSVQQIHASQAWFGGFQTHNGLEILVKKSLVQEGAEFSDLGFLKITRTKLAALFGYKRGVLYARFTTRSGRSLLVATSHFTPNLGGPIYNQESTRRKQALETINHLKTLGEASDYVILAGDLNFSPEFEHKVQDGRESDAEDAIWQASAGAYPLFVEESGLVDTYPILHSDKGYTQDRARNPVTNVSPSTDGEPEQRLDYVWVGSYVENRSLRVHSVKMVFDQPLEDKNGQPIQAEQYDGPLFMSDHFGLCSEISIY